MVTQRTAAGAAGPGVISDTGDVDSRPAPPCGCVPVPPGAGPGRAATAAPCRGRGRPRRARHPPLGSPAARCGVGDAGAGGRRAGGRAARRAPGGRHRSRGPYGTDGTGPPGGAAGHPGGAGAGTGRTGAGARAAGSAEGRPWCSRAGCRVSGSSIPADGAPCGSTVVPWRWHRMQRPAHPAPGTRAGQRSDGSGAARQRVGAGPRARCRRRRCRRCCTPPGGHRPFDRPARRAHLVTMRSTIPRLTGADAAPCFALTLLAYTRARTGQCRTFDEERRTGR